MESINPDDIDDLDHNLISLITLKNGNMLSIDDSIPPKKKKKNSDKSLKHRNYQISQKLINLTIISKKEKLYFNSKNKNCKNIHFCYNPNKKENKNKEYLNSAKKKEKNKNDYLFENLGNTKSNHDNNKKINKNNFGIIKNDLNKEEKEIEKIKTIENDIDSLNDKSKNEFKTIINEFDHKSKDKLKLEHRINNINALLNYNIKVSPPKNFDFTNQFNSLVQGFKNRIKDMKNESLNKRYYEYYKSNKNYKNQNPFNNYIIENNNFGKKNKNNNYLTISSVIKSRDALYKNNNIKYSKDRFFNKHSSFDPKIFRTLYLGNQIILPSNRLNI